MLYPLSYMLHLLCAVLLRQILYKYLSLPSLVLLFLPQSPEHWCYGVSEHFCFFSFFPGETCSDLLLWYYISGKLSQCLKNTNASNTEAEGMALWPKAHLVNTRAVGSKLSTRENIST